MEQNDTIARGVGIGLAAVGLVVFVITLVVAIFYLLSLQKALNRCSPECRAMKPGMVWLMLIPVFNLVWQFFVVLNMAKSLAAEFQKRGLVEEPNPGQPLGLAMCILVCCGWIPLLGLFASLAGVVCWILYWVKIAGYSKKLEFPAVAPAIPA